MSLSRRLPLALSLALLVTPLLGACAPNTIIRRTALINAPQAPTREGLPLERGDVRLEAHLSALNTAHSGVYYEFQPFVAEVGDPGVLIPDFQLGASVWFGLPFGLEIGGQFYFASMDWAEPNTAGVLPFPSQEKEDLLMGGLGMRFTIDVGNPQIVFAILGELNFANIPEAIFICTDETRCSSGEMSSDFEGTELYTFERVDHELFILPNLGLQLGWRFGDLAKDDEAAAGVPPDPEHVRVSFMPYLSLGLQASVTNTGFEADLSTLPDDSLETLWMGYVGFGVDALIEKLVLGASMIIPLESEDAINFGVAFNFRLGVQL